MKGFKKRLILKQAQKHYQKSLLSQTQLNSQNSQDTVIAEPEVIKKVKVETIEIMPIIPPIQASANPEIIKQEVPKQEAPKLQVQQPVVNVQFQQYSRVSGLNNIGNTCYLNSALQCVINTPGFNELFLNDKVKHEINPKQKQVAQQYWSLIKRMRSQGGCQNPAQLKTNISNATKKFRGNRQEDSQEFLRALITCLHEDLNRITKTPIYQELTADLTKSTLQEISNKWYTYFKGRDNSIVSDYFTGQLLNRVTCSVCNYQSIAFDNFQDLSLAFPKQYSNNQISIENMIKQFLQDEELNNSWTCAKCRKTRKCIRQFEIWKLPQVMVLHLKRFQYQGHKRNKINMPVQYNTQLDMKPFIKSSQDQTIKDSNYQLYGIVKHFGDLNFGHYYAECKHPFTGKWYALNDSSVGEIKQRCDVDETAYLLFYSKQ